MTVATVTGGSAEGSLYGRPVTGYVEHIVHSPDCTTVLRRAQEPPQDLARVFALICMVTMVSDLPGRSWQALPDAATGTA